MSKEILPCFAACEAINPKNPEMVAETLPEIFELLQLMTDYNNLHYTNFDEKYPQFKDERAGKMRHLFFNTAKNLLEKSTDNLPF